MRAGGTQVGACCKQNSGHRCLTELRTCSRPAALLWSRRRAGDALFRLGLPADEFWLLESGSVVGAPSSDAWELRCAMRRSGCPAATALCLPSIPPALAVHVDFALTTVHSRAQLPGLPPDVQPQHGERIVKHGPGSIVGEVRRPRRGAEW